MIIAFIGNDGSGKTLFSKEIEKILKKKNYPVEYKPGFNHLFLNRVLNCWRKITGKDIERVRKEYFDVNRKKKDFLFLVWPYLVLSECFIICLIYKFKRNQITIFDRYFYDYLMTYKYLGYNNFLIEKLFLFLPKPDVGFVLDVSPEIAYQRKKEDHEANLNYYQIQRQNYLRLAKAKDLQIINTEKSFEKIVRELLKILKTRIKI